MTPTEDSDKKTPSLVNKISLYKKSRISIHPIQVKMISRSRIMENTQTMPAFPIIQLKLDAPNAKAQMLPE
jgi:hypothetical protein